MVEYFGKKLTIVVAGDLLASANKSVIYYYKHSLIIIISTYNIVCRYNISSLYLPRPILRSYSSPVHHNSVSVPISEASSRLAWTNRFFKYCKIYKFIHVFLTRTLKSINNEKNAETHVRDVNVYQQHEYASNCHVLIADFTHCMKRKSFRRKEKQ